MKTPYRLKLTTAIFLFSSFSVLFACFSFSAKKNFQKAPVYYVDADAGNDNNSGLSAGQAWKSIDRVNKAESNNEIVPGCKVLFKRGATFTGTLNILVSGISGAPIMFADYGEGAKPVISGLIAVTNWQPLRSGIWEANCPAGDEINMLLINGVNTAMGRYPNADAPNAGYLTISSHQGLTSITGDMATRDNFTGADLVIRKNPYTIDRNIINSQSGSTINYTSGTQIQPIDGFGFFIENSPLTLDRPGEWYYNNREKKLQVFFGRENPNSNNTVQATAIKNLVSSRHQDYQVFKNISFIGSNENALDIYNSDHLSVVNCDVSFAGRAALYAYSCDDAKIENSSFRNTNTYAVGLNISNSVVRDNTITNAGLIVGMMPRSGRFAGIIQAGNNNLIEYNTLDSLGAQGISFAGDSLTIKNNYVKNFALLIDDTGGIYGGKGNNNRLITGNIIINGYGNLDGTNRPSDLSTATGIYLDDKTTTVDVENNTVAYCSIGIKIHNAQQITARTNTLYNNKQNLVMQHDQIAPNNPIRNINVKNNIVFSNKALQSLSYFASLTDDFKDFGDIDSNCYVKPNGGNMPEIRNSVIRQGRAIKSDFAPNDWKNMYKKENHSKFMSINANEEVFFQYNQSKRPQSVNLNGTYADVNGTVYSSQIQIQPYTSVILVRKR